LRHYPVTSVVFTNEQKGGETKPVCFIAG